MAPEDEGVIAYRLKAVEEGLARIQDSMDARFDRLGTQVASLGFVSRETFEEYRRSATAYNEETRAIAQSSRTASVAILMTVAGLILSAAIGLVVAVAK